MTHNQLQIPGFSPIPLRPQEVGSILTPPVELEYPPYDTDRLRALAADIAALCANNQLAGVLDTHASEQAAILLEGSYTHISAAAATIGVAAERFSQHYRLGFFALASSVTTGTLNARLTLNGYYPLGELTADAVDQARARATYLDQSVTAVGLVGMQAGQAYVAALDLSTKPPTFRAWQLPAAPDAAS